MVINGIELPDILSHYTDRSGLEGIARTRTLWATHFLDVNDQREIIYAYVQVLKAGLLAALNEIPDDQKETTYSDIDLSDPEDQQIYHPLRAALLADAKIPIYVLSFARGEGQNYQRTGIRSLWKQVGADGYCLQFRTQDIISMIETENRRYNYHAIWLSPVSYQMDREKEDFKSLVFQATQQLLQFVRQSRPDIRTIPKHEQMWTKTEFGAKIMEYAARHKDPYYEDEREFRVIAFPADGARSEILSGIFLTKRVGTSAVGKRFIELGKSNGVEPNTILAGPKANRDFEGLFSNWRALPEIGTARVPEI
jgi:hypothetical protein